MSKQVVLGIFESEAAAERAVTEFKAWDEADDKVKLNAIGVLVLDEHGKVKTEKVGRRTTGKGAGIGLILALITPVGLAAGLIGGGILGALHHKGLGISAEARERIGQELKSGRAAVGILVEPTEGPAVTAKITELGGTPLAYDIDDSAIAEADQAVESGVATGTPSS